MSGAILVLSGPSGAGKSSILEKALPFVTNYHFSVSTTTRLPRDGEVEGEDYYFVSKQAFEDGVVAGHYLEYANVHGNYYGTSKLAVQEALDMDKLVIFDIDVQGHRILQEKLGAIITSVFITPPSLSELSKRLHQRGKDSEDVIAKRIINSNIEIQSIDEYDFVLVNDDLQRVVSEFVDIVKTCRYKKTTEELLKIKLKWKD